MPRSTARILASLLALALTGAMGCDPPPAPMDAGTDAPMVIPDSGPPPVPYSCDTEPTVITGVMNVTETVMFDTTMTEERPRDLGLACGNTANEVRWARQEIIEYRVPGTGPVAVEFSSVNASTDASFDTLFQVRTSCSDVPNQAFPPTCFDNTTTMEVRASGAYQTTGGSTFYLIVTGHSDPEPVSMDVDEGPIEVSITPRANTPPTITEASSVLAGVANIFTATANDAEGPIFGFALQLFIGARQIDFDGDGDADDDDVLLFQWESVMGTGPYRATSTITPMEDGFRLAEYCRAVGCTEAGIAVFDRQYARSAFLRVPVQDGIIVGNGEACDAGRTCAAGLVCTSGICRVTPAATAACAAAMTIPLAIPTSAAMPTMAAVTGAISRGPGVFASPCSTTGDPVMLSTGREGIFRIDIPTPGRYRLGLSTAGPTTGANDTLLYVRGADCWDGRPSASVACNDDIDTPGRNFASAVSVDVNAGTYYAFVEFYRGETAASFDLTATLTLLMAGDAGMPADAGASDAGADAGEPDAGVDAGG